MFLYNNTKKINSFVTFCVFSSILMRLLNSSLFVSFCIVKKSTYEEMKKKSYNFKFLCRLSFVHTRKSFKRPKRSPNAY